MVSTPLLRITAIIPARDEALSIGHVIRELQQLTIHKQRLIEHIIVVNNGSNDETKKIAREHGAMVVNEPRLGYGSACAAGVLAVHEADIVVFVDGDQSCCIPDISALYQAIMNGADLAMGSRTLGNIAPNAMTPIQRFGTALICRVMAMRTGKTVTDLGPLRMIRYEKLLALDMQDRRFGWTAEMQMKAYRSALNVIEIPTRVRPRLGRSKISGTMKGTILAGLDLLHAALTQ